MPIYLRIEFLTSCTIAILDNRPTLSSGPKIFRIQLNSVSMCFTASGYAIWFIRFGRFFLMISLLLGLIIDFWQLTLHLSFFSLLQPYWKRSCTSFSLLAPWKSARHSHFVTSLKKDCCPVLLSKHHMNANVLLTGWFYRLINWLAAMLWRRSVFMTTFLCLQWLPATSTSRLVITRTLTLTPALILILTQTLTLPCDQHLKVNYNCHGHQPQHELMTVLAPSWIKSYLQLDIIKRMTWSLIEVNPNSGAWIFSNICFFVVIGACVNQISF